MASLRDAAFALDAPGSPWSVRDTLEKGFWPALAPASGGGVSVRALMKRYSAAGAKLRTLASGSGDVWAYISRSELVPELRARLRDPGIILQNPTGLCGPLSVVVELARRLPAEYVRAVTEMLETGKWTTIGGMVVTAEQELRNEPTPAPPIGKADWILAATMRDNENIHEDVDDDANGLESITLWGAMSDWTHHALGLKYHWESCFHGGELDAIRVAQKAVDAGGVAFLLIDSDLIQSYKRGEAQDEEEEEMYWRRAFHNPGEPVGDFGTWTHSKDDNFPPDHWILLLGGLQLPRDGSIKLRVWSWSAEYELKGTADSFTEYLYAVVTGVPW